MSNGRYVIDTMQSICCLESGVSSSGSWEEETTLVGLTFGGYLLSKVNINLELGSQIFFLGGKNM